MNERPLVTIQIGDEDTELHHGLATSSKSRHTQEIKWEGWIEILLLLIIKVKASRDWWVDEPTYHLKFNISFQIKILLSHSQCLLNPIIAYILKQYMELIIQVIICDRC